MPAMEGVYTVFPLTVRLWHLKRHANRSRDIEGLYFAGGSVHPGGGIPLTILSGKMAAELIAEHAEKHGKS